MTDRDRSRHSRRRLIKILMGSGAAVALARVAPERWTRPVVQAVVLPAHAQMSHVLNGTYHAEVTAALASIDGRLLDYVIRPALANNYAVRVCLTDIVGNVVGQVALGIANYLVLSDTNVSLPFDLGPVSFGPLNFTEIRITGVVTGDQVSGKVTFKDSGTPEFADYDATLGSCPNA